jgi:hypothetical protein
VARAPSRSRDGAELVHDATATRKALTFYDLRATGITWCAVRGDEELKIMHRAGHENFSTTKGYVREAEAIRAGFGVVWRRVPSPAAVASRRGIVSGIV